MAAAGSILALLFTATVLVVRTQTLSAHRTELKTALDAFLLDPNEPFDIEEFHEAHPTFTVGIYGGASPQVVGSLPIPRGVGFRQTHDELAYGREFQRRQIVAVSDLSETERGMRSLALVLLGLWAPLTILIGSVTYLAARAVFRPLERLTVQATTAAGSELEMRLSTEDRAEFGDFARALNGMLDRIETEVKRGDRFAADAAHELRTPLALLRARIEVALLNPRTSGEYVDVLRRTNEEIIRLIDIAQALLRTARGETATAVPLDLEPPLIEIVRQWHGRFAAHSIDLRLTSEAVIAQITAEELQIALDNLLDNALRFAPQGSVVSVTLQRQEHEAELAVQDTGDGFSEGLGDQAFDRLVRGDDSRNRATGGAGIGLSVVRRIVESRGGNAFHRPTPGGGATVAIVLPLAERILNPTEGETRPIVSL